MKRQDYKELGFEEITHFTVTRSMNYDLGNDRILSAGCVDSPNEMITISQRSSDVVVVYNWDYDGEMTKERLQKLIDFFKME